MMKNIKAKIWRPPEIGGLCGRIVRIVLRPVSALIDLVDNATATSLYSHICKH